MWRWLATAGGLGVLGAVEQANGNEEHHDLQPREGDTPTVSRMARAGYEGFSTAHLHKDEDHAKCGNHQEVVLDKVQNC